VTRMVHGPIHSEMLNFFSSSFPLSLLHTTHCFPTYTLQSLCTRVQLPNRRPFEFLLRIFTGIGKGWPLAILHCAMWWNRLLAVSSWPPPRAAVTPGPVREEKTSAAPEAVVAEKVYYSSLSLCNTGHVSYHRLSATI
jgi:hypothetical protein